MTDNNRYLSKTYVLPGNTNIFRRHKTVYDKPQLAKRATIHSLERSSKKEELQQGKESWHLSLR